MSGTNTTTPGGANAVLVGYGDFGTKSSGVRARMAGRVADDVEAALSAAGIDAAVERPWSRIVIRTDGPTAVDRAEQDRPRRSHDPTASSRARERGLVEPCSTAAARVAATLPGVSFARPAVAVDPRMEPICAAARALAAAEHPAEETYAVDADRVGPSDAHDFSSRDLAVEAGRVVGEVTGATVDLDDPERTYRIEARESEAFVSVRRFDGPGGLPVGTQGRVAVLVSGGIDSPVAAWRLLRRGCVVVPVYVDLGDYGGPDHRARAIEVIQELGDRAPRADLRPRVVDGGAFVERVVDATRDTRMLSLRRAMLAAAEGVAEREGAHGVATGEALGQKSSQTGANLAVTDAAVSLPVHRPLLTVDKPDIVAEARELGTYADATLPVGCDRIAPSHPETNATRSQVTSEEPDDLLESAREAGRRAETVGCERPSFDTV